MSEQEYRDSTEKIQHPGRRDEYGSALCSSLSLSLITLSLSGALSAKIGGQLGKALPWFRPVIYLVMLLSAIFSLLLQREACV